MRKQLLPHGQITVARKLTVVLHRVWRDGSIFRWSDE